MSDSNEQKKKKNTQIHSPTVVQRGRGGGRLEPLPGVFDILLVKASFDLLNKMRYILWVMSLLETCDVTNIGRHLGFY